MGYQDDKTDGNMQAKLHMLNTIGAIITITYDIS